MCAIKPIHKKRFIIDCYTSSEAISKETFEKACIEKLCKAEVQLNMSCSIRFHLKESTEEAE